MYGPSAHSKLTAPVPALYESRGGANQKTIKKKEMNHKMKTYKLHTMKRFLLNFALQLGAVSSWGQTAGEHTALEQKNCSGKSRLFLATIMILFILFGSSVLMAQITSTYNYPSTGSFTVPAGVTSITITAYGGGGGHGGTDCGAGCTNQPAGPVGYVSGTYSVSPGSTIGVYPGGQGSNGANSASGNGSGAGGSATYGGFNGGNGGNAGSSGSSGAGGGGGAATVLTNSSGIWIVAGGAGGGGGACNTANSGTPGSASPVPNGSSHAGGAGTVVYSAIGLDGGGGGGGGGGYPGSYGGGLGPLQGSEHAGIGGYVGSNSSGTSTTDWTSPGKVTISYNAVGGSSSASPTALCSGSSSTISLTGNVGSIQWQISSDGSNWSNISGATSLTYNTGSLTATRYYRALISGSVASTASMVTVYNATTAPTSATCPSKTNTTANLSWGTGTGNGTITYYWVVGTSSSVTHPYPGTTNTGTYYGYTTGTTATATGLSPNTGYYLRVYASATCGNSVGYQTSPMFTTLTNPPVANAASLILANSFTANWTATTGATAYYLDVATNSGFTAFVSGYNNKNVGNVTSYALSGLSNNSNYYYRVRAVNTGGTSDQSNTINPTTLAVNNFLIEAVGGGSIGTQTAGVPFSVKITARDSQNSTVTDYTGTATITTNSVLSAGGTTANFVAGVLSSHSVTLTQAGISNKSLTASIVSPNVSSTSNLFTVDPAAINHWTLAVDGTVTAGSPFTVTATVYDQFGNLKTNYNGANSVNWSTTAISSPLPSGMARIIPANGNQTFTNGVSAGITGFTFFNSDQSQLTPFTGPTITITDGPTAVAGTTAAITVHNAPLDNFKVVAGTTQTAGTPFDVTVTARDVYMNTCVDYAGNIRFKSSDDALVTFPGGLQSFAPASTYHGVETFTNGLKVNTVGAYWVRAADAVYAYKSGEQQNIVVGPGVFNKNAIIGPLTISTLDVDQTTRIAGEYVVVTLVPRDAEGNLLYACRDISVLLNDAASDHNGSIIVNNVGDGSYTATVRVTLAGDNIISARYNSTGEIWSQTRTVTVSPAPADLAHTTITPAVGSITTNEHTTITVQLKDAFDNNRTTDDGVVSLTTSLGGFANNLGTKTINPTYNGSGSYITSLYAFTDGNNGTGTAGITGSVNFTDDSNPDGPITHPASVAITEGLPDLTTSTVSATPGTITTNGTSAITVQLKDFLGNIIPTNRGAITLAVSPNGAIVTPATFSAGTYHSTLSGNFPGNGSTTITGYFTGTGSALTVAGTITNNAQVTFNEGLPDLAHIQITALPTTMTSDGSSVITVQLKDVYGNNLTTSRGTVTLSSNKGALTGVTDHGDGTYTATLSGDNRGFGDATVTGHFVDVTDAINGDISDNAVVNITQGKPALAKIDVSPASGNMTTDETRLITVQLKDQFGNNLTSSRGTVTLATSLTGTALTGVTDHTNGTYTATLSTTKTGTTTITGHLVDGPDVIDGAILDDAVVVIGEGKPALAQIDISASPTSISTDGTSTITIQLKDQWGNNLSTQRGTVALTAVSKGAITAATYQTAGYYTATLSGDNRGVGLTDITGVLTDVADGVTGTITHYAQATFTEGLPSRVTSTFAVDNATITTDGTSTVTITLKDQFGNLISDDRGEVTLSSTIGLLSSVTNNHNGTYTAILSGDKRGTNGTGTSAITGTFAGTGTASGVNGSFSNSTSVTINEGLPALATTDISAIPTTMTTDGTSLITVQLKDALGNLITHDRSTIVLSTNLGVLTGNGVYVSAGTYTATLHGNSSGTGTATITGTLNGSAIADNTTVTITEGAPSLATSTVSRSTASITTDGTATITVQLKDQFENNLTTSRGTVTLFTDLGALTAVSDHSNGTYTATLSGNSSGVGTAHITEKLDGSSLTNTTSIAITEGLPSLATTTFTPSAASITTDGTSVITIQLKDQWGNNIINNRGTVALSSTIGSLTAVSYTSLGQYTATLSGDTRGSNGLGNSVITGTLDAAAFSQSATVTITEGLPRLNKIQITANATSITADQTSIITVQLQDQFGNNITHSRGSISLSSAGLTGTNISSVTDHSNGTYTAIFSMTGYGTGTATISGTFTGTGDASSISGSVSDGATIDVSNGVATKLAMKTQPSTTATAGVVFTQQPVLYIQDQFGNTVITDNSTVVTAARSAGTATLLSTGSLTATASAGIVSFSGLKYTKAETITLGFTSIPTLTTATSDNIVVAHADPAYMAVTGTSTQVAGASQTITVTVYDAFANQATRYTGDHSLTFTGANDATTSPVTHPTLGGTAFGTAKTMNFTAGVATGSMTLYKTETAVVTATDGSINADSHSLSVLVTPTLLKDFIVYGVPDPHDLGTWQPVTVEPRDTYNNRKTNYVGTITFSNTDIAATNPIDYQFKLADAGIHVFSNVSGIGTNQGVKFSQTGLDWWLTAVDLAEPAKYGYQSGITVQRAVTIASTSTGQTKTYGDVKDLGTTAFTITDIVSGLTSLTPAQHGITGVTLTSAGTVATATVAGSPYLIIPSAATGSYNPLLYRIVYANTGNLTVTQRDLTLSNFLANAKTYDGTTTVTGAGFSDNRVNSDVLTFGYTAAFASRNAALPQTVNYIGITINGGADAGNYHLVTTGGSTTANIAIRDINVTAQTDSKTYDGSTTSSILPIVGAVQTGDAVTTVGIQTYDTETYGTSKVLTPSGTVINDGNNGANYAVHYVTNNTGVIETRPITITVTAGQTKVYGDANPSSYAYTVTSGDLAPGDAFSGALSRAGGENVNSYAISQGSLTIIEGETYKLSNYAVTFVPANFMITARPITLLATDQSKTYGSTLALGTTAFTLTSGTYATGESVTAVVLASTGAINTASATTYDLTISGATGDGGFLASNYAITYTKGTLTVNPKELIVTATAGQTKVYGENDPVFAYTATGYENGEGTSIFTGALSRDAGIHVGTTYAINQNNLSAGGNYYITYHSANFSITAKPVTITATAGQHKTYGDLNPASYTYSANVPLAYSDKFSGALSRADGETVANYAIGLNTLTIVDNSTIPVNVASDYAIAYIGANFAITPLTVTVTANAGQSKIYGEAEPASFAYTSSPTVGTVLTNGEVISFTGSLTRTGGENVGTYAINQGSLANGNYTITYVSHDFSVYGRLISLTASNQSKTYGSTLALGTTAFTLTSGTYATGESVTAVVLASTGAINTASATTYDLTISGATGDGGFLASNYAITYTKGTLTVNPKELIVTATAGQTKVYGENDPVFAYTATGFENGEGTSIFTGALTRVAGIHVGTNYTINQANLSAGGNYTISYVPANFSITAKPVTITATAGQHKTYGELDPSTFAYSTTNLAYSDKFSGALSRADGETVANYAIGLNTLTIVDGSAVNVASDYAITYVGATFAIDKLTVAVTANSGQSKIYGQNDPTFTYTSIPAVGSALANGLLISFDGSLNRAIGETVASYAIGQGSLANSNYTIGYTGTNFAITPKAIDGNFTVTSSRVYDGGTLANITGRTLNGVINSDDVTLSGGTANYNNKNVGVGKTVTLTGYGLSGNDAFNYTLTSVATTTADITVRTLTLANFGADSKEYDGTTLATGIGFTDNRVSGDNLSFGRDAAFRDQFIGLNKPVDYTNIRISGGADRFNYVLASTIGTAYADITPRHITITANNKLKTYGTAITGGTGSTLFTAVAYDIDSHPVSLPNGETISSVTIAYGTGALATDAAGTYTGHVIPSAAIGANGFVDGNYIITYVNGDIVVDKKDASVVVAAKTKEYGSSDPVLTGTLTGFMPADNVVAAYSRIAGETVTGGPYAITAVLTPTEVLSNYNITNTPAAMTITRKAASVSPIANSKVYGSSDPTLAGNLAGFLDADAVTATYSRTLGETVGSSPYTISAVLSSAGVLSNYDITYNTAAFAITVKDASVIVAAKTKEYGAADPTLTGTLTGFMPADNVVAAYSRVAGETVTGGPYAITAVLTPTGMLGNYNITNTPASLTINRKAASVSPIANSKVYGSSDPTLAGNLAGFLDADAVTAAYSRTLGETVGSSPYTISAVLSPAGLSSNYDITYNTAVFAITAKDASVVVAAKTKEYGAADPILTGALTGFMPADNVVAAYSRVAGETVPGGPYAITAVLTPTGMLSNYNITNTPAALTITRKVASVSPIANSKVYGSSDPTLAGNLAGFLDADAVIAAYSRILGETVGSSPYTISAILSPAGILSNYDITYNTAAFTITAKDASVVVAAKTKEYGASDPTLTGVLTGFMPADNVVAAYSRIAGETVTGGPYAITAVLTPTGMLSNYNITNTPAALTITRKAASVSPIANSKVYGSSDPTLAGTLTGFLSGDAVTAAYSRTLGESVGASPYTISAILSPAGILANYDITYNTAAFAINKAPLTIAASNRAKCFGQTVTFLGTEFTHSALVSGDAVTGVTLTSLGSVSGAAVNTYPIVASNATGTGLLNYNIGYVDGTLTVNALPVPIITGSGFICVGRSTVYTTEPSMTGYVWSISAGGTITAGAGTDAITVTWNTAGAQTVSVNYNNANGCTATTATVYNVTVNPLPTAAITGTNTICAGTNTTISVALTGTAPWSITYTNGTPVTVPNIATSPYTFSVSPAAGSVSTYTVTSVSDAHVCSNTGTGSAVITVRPTYVAPTVSSAQTLCYGSTPAVLSATAASGASNGTFTYKWQKSLNNSIWTDISPVETGMTYAPGALFGSTYYRILATDANCGDLGSNSVFITVHNPLTKPVVSSAQTICSGSSPNGLTATPASGGNEAFTYQWQSSTDGTSWTNVGTNSLNFQPAALTVATQFRVIGNGIGTPNCGASYSNVITIGITPDVTTPVFADGSTSTRCSGAETVIYTATASNTSGITYSLDATTATFSGNSIVALTGAVTYAALWHGTTVITASAAGCNGPKTSTHTVTVNATVGTPVFALGATSSRCQTAGNVTYSATNDGPIVYTLDATSRGAGNSINSGTGVVTYAANWSGTSVITASSTGCNATTTATHTVTTNPTVGIPVQPSFVTGTHNCQSAGISEYTTVATNATSYTWSIDGTGNSIAGTGTTGTVTWASGFSGTATITVTATNGCGTSVASTGTTVTVNPTLATPVFASGNDTRCKGTGTVTYSATATNSTSIVYSLDATSAAFTGNSIVASTGAVTYSANWSGTTTITATAYDACNNSLSAAKSVTVYPSLVASTASGDQTICYGSATSALTISSAATEGSGSYIYHWQSSTDGNNWTNNGDGSLDPVSLDPGSLFETTYYRVVASDACSAVPSNTVTVSVYSPFTEPEISSAQTTCYNTAPTLLSSTAATGGSGTFSYQWQMTTTPSDPISWTNIGANALSFQSAALTATTSFRLIANDIGSHSCGSIYSNEVVVTVNSAVTAGTIGADQVITGGATPSPITSLTDGTGATGFTYAWESSVDGGSSWSPIALATGSGYAPGILYQTTWYHRITLSTENSTVCTATTGVIKINVNIRLNATVMLEGAINGSVMNTGLTAYLPLNQPYNGTPWSYNGTESVGSIPSGVVDWVLVELRQATRPDLATSGTILAKRAAFVLSNGSIVDLNGTSPVSFGNSYVAQGNNLYVVVRHRNHLAVMSNTGAIQADGVYSFDFTTGVGQAYGSGSGYKQVGTKSVMVVGDVDQDGNIFVSDYNLWATGFGQTNGYFNWDLDMDGSVYVSDYNKWAVNFGSTIATGIKSAQIRSKYFSSVPK